MMPLDGGGGFRVEAIRCPGGEDKSHVAQTTVHSNKRDQTTRTRLNDHKTRMSPNRYLYHHSISLFP
jgi:hypothetical protein